MTPIFPRGCVFIALLLVALVGCGGPPDRQGELTTLVFSLRHPEPGMQTFPTPRTFDPPGTVFRLDSADVRHDVTDLSKELYAQDGEEAVPSMTMTALGAAKGALRFFGIAEAKGSSSSNVSVKAILPPGTRAKTNDEALKDPIRRYFDANPQQSGMRYFVITETVAFSSIDFEIDETSAEEMGGDVTLRKISASGGAYSKTSGMHFIKQTFSRPHRVFYKVDTIAPTTKGGDISLTPVEVPLYWSD